MLFGQSSEKKRHKLENQIRQAEKRLSELENRLNTARNLLEDASSVTDSPDTSPPSENPIASKPESPDENLHENRCRQNFPGRHIAFCLLKPVARPVEVF